MCFFQAEDGIRDSPVTGVQTCALPISIADTLDSLTSTATTITGLTNDRLYGFYVTSVDNSDYESSASSLARLTPTYLGPVWYVDVNDGGVSAEGSPGDPFRDLQDAIDVSSAGDTVLVLPGTYAGNRSDNRELEFVSGDGSAKNIVQIGRASCRERG